MEVESRKCTLITFIAFMLINTGCSINSVGFPGSVEEQSFYSNYSHIIQTKATGVHLDTRASFELHIGYMEREMVYPRISDDTLLCTQQLIVSDDTKRLDEPLIFAEDPIKISVQSQGARLSLSPHFLGFSFGYINRKVLSVSADSSLSMFYKNNNNEKKQGIQVCAVIESKN